MYSIVEAVNTTHGLHKCAYRRLFFLSFRFSMGSFACYRSRKIKKVPERRDTPLWHESLRCTYTVNLLWLSKLHNTPCPASGESDSGFSFLVSFENQLYVIVDATLSSVTCVPWASASHTWGCTYPLKRMRQQCIWELITHKLLLGGLTSPLDKPFSCYAQLQFSRKTVFQHLIEFSEHRRSLPSAEAAVTSPLAVDFRGFMARQPPHVIYRQAGRLVGLQRQWGEPVQSHKWEEASVINWVLVSGIENKMRKWVRCLKVQAYTEVQCWGRQAHMEAAPLLARVDERWIMPAVFEQ